MLSVLGYSMLALTALAGLANAGSYDTVIRHDVALHYRGAELSSDESARMLLVRISMAAKQACGGSALMHPAYDMSPTLAHRDFAKCQADAIARAVQTLNSPALARVYASADSQALRVAGR